LIEKNFKGTERFFPEDVPDLGLRINWNWPMNDFDYFTKIHDFEREREWIGVHGFYCECSIKK
jgi:hypothetical protein